MRKKGSKFYNQFTYEKSMLKDFNYFIKNYDNLDALDRAKMFVTALKKQLKKNVLTEPVAIELKPHKMNGYTKQDTELLPIKEAILTQIKEAHKLKNERVIKLDKKLLKKKNLKTAYKIESEIKNIQISKTITKYAKEILYSLDDIKDEIK